MFSCEGTAVRKFLGGWPETFRKCPGKALAMESFYKTWRLRPVTFFRFFRMPIKWSTYKRLFQIDKIGQNRLFHIEFFSHCHRNNVMLPCNAWFPATRKFNWRFMTLLFKLCYNYIFRIPGQIEIEVYIFVCIYWFVYFKCSNLFFYLEFFIICYTFFLVFFRSNFL